MPAPANEVPSPALELLHPALSEPDAKDVPPAERLLMLGALPKGLVADAVSTEDVHCHKHKLSVIYLQVCFWFYYIWHLPYMLSGHADRMLQVILPDHHLCSLLRTL
jgi:hypothetical protein